MQIVDDGLPPPAEGSRPPAFPDDSVPSPIVSACTRVIAAGVLIVPILCGCTTPPSDPAGRAAFEENNDPLEPLNRKVFEVNQFADRLIFKPIAKAYVFAIPADGRGAIRHILDNMKEPTLFINNLLQGEFDRAGTTLGRFTVNTSIGFVGLFDVAGAFGLKRQPADFGQTLYVWGVPSGPYLIVPILGPSNPRDAFGGMVDSYADPATAMGTAYGFQELMTARFLADGIDKRAKHLDDLDILQKNALDFYAELRSLSQQQRASDLRRGAPPGPEFYNLPKPGAAPNPPPHPAARPLASPPSAAKPAPPPPAPAGASAPVATTGAAPLEWSADPEEGPLRTSAPQSGRR
jgi:phospholipid-binding lipoprotein MlaA